MFPLLTITNLQVSRLCIIQKGTMLVYKFAIKKDAFLKLGESLHKIHSCIYLFTREIFTFYSINQIVCIEKVLFANKTTLLLSYPHFSNIILPSQYLEMEYLHIEENIYSNKSYNVCKIIVQTLSF